MINDLISRSVVLIIVASVGITVLTFALMFGFALLKRKKVQNLLATGTQGTATILSLEDTGMRINDDPRVRMMMDVTIPGFPPYRVQKTATVSVIRLSQVQVGATVQVIADPSQPNNPDKLGLLLR